MTSRPLHRLSASSLAVFLECPRCFWLSVHEDLRRPQGPFPSLPSGIDGVLKTYFDSYRAKGELPPDARGKLPGKLFADRTTLDAWRNNRQGIQTQRPDLGIELTGALDDVLQEDNRVSPLDFKTRGYALKENTHTYYQHQLDLYAYLLDRNGHATTGRGFLLFYWPAEVNDGGRITFHIEPVELATDTERAQQLLRDASRILRGPLPARHPACAFCRFTLQNAMFD